MESCTALPFDATLLDLPELQEGAVLTAVGEVQQVVHGLTAKERCAAALQLLRSIDLTSLNATDTAEEVTALIDRAVQPLREIFPTAWQRAVKCPAVCFYPTLLPQAYAYRKEKYPQVSVKLAVVAGGFPSGQFLLDTKMLEVQLAVEDGADEVDVVINRGMALEGDWKQVYDEVSNMKMKCLPKVRMKTILGVGELNTLENVYKASMVAMMAGSDFIKTSTGKESVNANLRHSYVMCLAISQFFQATGRRIGFKAAGGIKKIDDALTYLFLVKRMLGDEWTKDLFRIGASSLLNDVVEYFKHLPRDFNLKLFLDD